MTPCFALKNMIGYDIDQKTPCYALKNMIGCDIDQKISGAMHQILSDQAVSMSTFLASNQNAGNKKMAKAMDQLDMQCTHVLTPQQTPLGLKQRSRGICLMPIAYTPHGSST